MPVMDIHTSISDVDYRAYASYLVQEWQNITQKTAFKKDAVFCVV